MNDVNVIEGLNTWVQLVVQASIGMNLDWEIIDRLTSKLANLKVRDALLDKSRNLQVSRVRY
jgi:hypothetical protein